MQRNLIEKLASASADRTWSDDQLMQMDKRLLQYLATYNGSASAIPEKYREQLVGKVVHRADSEAALKIFSSSASRSVSHLRPDTYINTNGGSMFYTPTQVKLIEVSGDERVRPNSVIPTRFDEVEKYPNCQHVAALCSQLVKNDKGNWVSNFNVLPWMRALDKSTLNAAAFLQISNSMTIILNDDRVWRGLPLVSRNSIAGLEQLSFIRQAIDRMGAVEYDMLNSRIVWNLLQPFSKSGGEWFRREIGKTVVIPEKCYELKRDSSAESKKYILAEGLPCVAWYWGGYVPQIVFPTNQENLASAIDSSRKMTELQGHGDSTTAILSEMRDYSGLTDEFGKRVQFFMAAILEGWMRGSIVDVVLSTVGDMPMLVSSCDYWAKKMRAAMEAKGETPPKCIGDVAFLPPKVHDGTKVNIKIRDKLTYHIRPDSLIVSYKRDGLPTSAEKNVKMDYELAAYSLIPPHWKNNHFIFYTPIYGEICFGGGQDGKLKHTTSGEVLKWGMQTFVYSFGTSSGFSGVLSTIPGLGLMGYGPVRDGVFPYVTFKEKDVRLHSFKLLQHPNSKSWYDRVARDCKTQSLTFLSPVSRYSPISNLIYLSKVGAQMNYQHVEAEDGQLIGNLAQTGPKDTARGVRLNLADLGIDMNVPFFPPTSTTTSTVTKGFSFAPTSTQTATTTVTTVTNNKETPQKLNLGPEYTVVPAPPSGGNSSADHEAPPEPNEVIKNMSPEEAARFAAASLDIEQG